MTSFARLQPVTNLELERCLIGQAALWRLLTIHDSDVLDLVPGGRGGQVEDECQGEEMMQQRHCTKDYRQPEVSVVVTLLGCTESVTVSVSVKC